MKKLSIFYPLVVGEDQPVLRKKAERVENFTPEVEEFSDALLELMYEYDGVGLAAPQVGQSIRMIAVTQRKEQKGKGKGIRRNVIGELVMVNPEILEHSETTWINEEACLSIPGIFGEVKRYKWIKVKYFTPQGKQIIKKLTGRDSVVVQHEIDHLEGILFTDKLVE